jgi:hypothetical protein
MFKCCVYLVGYVQESLCISRSFYTGFCVLFSRLVDKRSYTSLYVLSLNRFLLIDFSIIREVISSLSPIYTGLITNKTNLNKGILI